MNPKDKKPVIHKPTPAKAKTNTAVAMKANHKPTAKKKSDDGSMAKKVGLGVGGVVLLGLGGFGAMHMLHGGNRTQQQVSKSDADKSSDSSTLDFKSNKDKKNKKKQASKQSNAESDLNSILNSSSSSHGGSRSGSSRGSGSGSHAGNIRSLNNLFDGTAGGSGDGSLAKLAEEAKSSAKIADDLGGSKASTASAPALKLIDNAVKDEIKTGGAEIPAPINNTGAKGKDVVNGGTNTGAPANGSHSEDKNKGNGTTANNGGSTNTGKGNAGKGDTGKGNNNGGQDNGNTTILTPEHPNWDYTVGPKPERMITLLDKNGKKIGELPARVVVTSKGGNKYHFEITYDKSKLPKGVTLSASDQNRLIDAYFGNGKSAGSFKLDITAPDSDKDAHHDTSNENHFGADSEMHVSGSVHSGETQSYIKDFIFDGKSFGQQVGNVQFVGDEGTVTEIIPLQDANGKTYKVTRTVYVDNNATSYDGDANTKVKNHVTLAPVNVKVGNSYTPAQPNFYTNGQQVNSSSSGVTTNSEGKYTAKFRIGDTEFTQQVNFYDGINNSNHGNSGKPLSANNHAKSTNSRTGSASKNPTRVLKNETHEEAIPSSSKSSGSSSNQYRTVNFTNATQAEHRRA